MHSTPPLSLPTSQVRVVRIKLGPDREAPQPDYLGRSRVGYRDGLSEAEVWERARGLWKARLSTVSEADLAVIVGDEIVRAVATIGGVDFHDNRVAITGQLLPGHPLLGTPDPVPNASRNPVAYKTITTVGSEDFPPVQRPHAEILSSAISALTEAARWRRPVMRLNASGRWETDPVDTDSGDWAEFVTLALAGAAANVGGIEAVLAGRPGSWEAEGVRQLLHSTVGHDEDELWRHRTEPVRITLYVEELLLDRTESWLQYEQAADELRTRIELAEANDPEIDESAYLWIYERDDDGQWVSRQPGAPAWSVEAWRAGQRLDSLGAADLALVENRLLAEASGAVVPKSVEADAELDRLREERETRLGIDLEERLEEQRWEEWTAYGHALAHHIYTAAGLIPGLLVPVEVDVDVNTVRPPGPAGGRDVSDGSTLEDRLIDAAVMDVPSPADLPGTPLERLEQA